MPQCQRPGCRGSIMPSYSGATCHLCSRPARPPQIHEDVIREIAGLVPAPGEGYLYTSRRRARAQEELAEAH